MILLILASCQRTGVQRRRNEGKEDGKQSRYSHSGNGLRRRKSTRCAGTYNSYKVLRLNGVPFAANPPEIGVPGRNTVKIASRGTRPLRSLLPPSPY